ncbi:hypothetical protein [Emticicia sp. 17c]|uniref:hypothetical protein n=1 Tax=Emticicia sp. 17c TaxID=3127704 RepID=UPI00301DE3DB
MEDKIEEPKKKPQSKKSRKLILGALVSTAFIAGFSLLKSKPKPKKNSTDEYNPEEDVFT